MKCAIDAWHDKALKWDFNFTFDGYIYTKFHGLFQDQLKNILKIIIIIGIIISRK